MVRLTLKRSRSLTLVCIGVHAAAAATALQLDVALAVKALAGVCCAASAVHALLKHALLELPDSIRAIEIRDREHGALIDGTGAWREARIAETTYVTSMLTVINFRLSESRQTRHVLLVPDNTATEPFREARVLLRWRRAVPTPMNDVS